MTEHRAPGEAGKVLSLRVGDQHLAVPAEDVTQIVRPPPLTRVPHAPACLSGMANIRGTAVPVLSLARLLGREDGQASARGRVVLLNRTPPLGLAVDEVTALATAGVPSGGSAGTTQLFLDGEAARRLIDLDGLLAREFGAFRRKSSGAQQGGSAAAVPRAAAMREIGLLGFDLAGQSYALPIEHIREVIALPPGLLTLPRADDVGLGVIAYRDALLPLASLRVLLGLPPAEPSRSGRAIVIKLGRSVIGLVVDRLRAVLRAPDTAIRPVPSVLNRGAGEAQIESIYRAADGTGLVSVLAPEHLFRDETTARILADGRERGAETMAESQGGGRERFVIFHLGEETYGLPIGAVEEVVRLPDPLTRIPRAPAFVDGVMNLRGRVIPVIDLRRRFDVDDGATIGRRRVLVTRIGDVQAGFIVDTVSEIADLAREQLSVAPDLAAEGGRLFDRVANLALDRRMVLLVDPEAMLDRVETDLLKVMNRSGQAPGSS
jgi:purine-binding chemotaxis protein CheW